MSFVTPLPWEPYALPNHDLAAIFAAIDRHAETLRRDHPDLAVPGTGCRSPYVNAGPFTIGSIISMWRDAPDWFTGSCTVCGGAARGTEISGLLVHGGITGWCLSCGAGLLRFVGGVPRVLTLLPKAARSQLFDTGASCDITVEDGLLVTSPTEGWWPPKPAPTVSWEPLLEVLATLE